MTDLKCPYCPEVRPTRGRLQQHVDSEHRDIPFEKRFAAVDTARTVEDVKVVDGDNDRTPYPADRAKLTLSLTEQNCLLKDVGNDLRDMKASLDEVDARMRALNSRLNAPANIRYATLSDVWDRLMEARHIEAAILVMDLIKEENK